MFFNMLWMFLAVRTAVLGFGEGLWFALRAGSGEKTKPLIKVTPETAEAAVQEAYLDTNSDDPVRLRPIWPESAIDALFLDEKTGKIYDKDGNLVD